MVPPASRRIPRVLRYSGTGLPCLLFVYGAFTLFGGAFQRASTKLSRTFCRPTTPGSMLPGLASFPFARRYLGNRCFFLFLRVLRCFSSPRALLMAYLIQPWMTGHDSRRVSPFGYLRINACLRLPEAFRSLPRPSSAYGAWASALCSCKLDFFVDSLLRPIFLSR